MSRRLTYQSRAAKDLESILEYIDQRSEQGAVNWLDRYEEVLNRIRENPEQFSQAPESTELTLPVRNAIVRTKKGLPYRVIFAEKTKEIVILSIRGPGQSKLKRQTKYVTVHGI